MARYMNLARYPHLELVLEELKTQPKENWMTGRLLSSRNGKATYCAVGWLLHSCGIEPAVDSMQTTHDQESALTDAYGTDELILDTITQLNDDAETYEEYRESLNFWH